MPETKYNPQTNEFEPVEDTSIIKLPGTAPWAKKQLEQAPGTTAQNIVGSVGTALSNVPSSAWNVAKDMSQIFLHPITTAQNIGGLAAGLVQKVIPGEQGQEVYADALGKYFVDRYGSLENVKKTFEEDPVGFAADISTIFTGGGSLAGRLPGVAGKIGKTVAKAGEYVDPLKAVGVAAEKTAELTGKGFRKIAGAATRTGEKSMEEALKAGLEGGEVLEKYKQAQKGITTPEDIVQNFKDALVTIRTKRGDKYQTEMMPLHADQTVLDWANIDQAIAKAEQAKTFQGQKLSSRKQQYIKDEMLDALNEWKSLDPSVYHTPSGMNALRQKLWNYVDDFELNSPERKAAGEIYHTIKKEITRQVPQYSKIMKGYEDASNLISEIERSLSLKKYGSTEAALRKLQTVLKSDVNPAYENRAKLVEYLVENGSPTLMSELAGLSHAPKISPGLKGKATTAAATAPALLFSIASNPLGLLAAVPGLALTSPRTMGNLNVLVGTGMRYGKKISETIPEPLKEALKKSPYASYYASQLEQEAPIQTDALPPWKKETQPLALSSNPNRVYNPETNEFEPTKAHGGSVTDQMHMASGGFVRWTPYDKTWKSLNPYQKAAVMSLMEADRANPEDAKNILGAMVNRATRSKEDLGTHVSKAIYQPTFEPSQRARLGKLLQHPAMPELTAWAQKRAQGLEPDNVGGATHYLAHEPVMLALQRKQPRKYRSWVKWTQFDPKTQTYGNVTMRDKSHAFLAPEGKYSAPYVAPQQVAGEVPPVLRTVTPEERDRAKLTQMAQAAASEAPTQQDMTNLVKETATVEPAPQQKTYPPDQQAKIKAFLEFLQKQEEQNAVAPVAPMSQAPRPEIPIVQPYAKAQAHGGSVTEKMHQARKKKVDGGAATNDDMTWGDVAEQYKQNIGPDVEKQAGNYLLQQYQAYKDPLGRIKEVTEPLQKAYEDPVGTLKGAAQGAYNLGKGAVDIGVGLGSKALGSLGYEPTGDIKYHREQPLEQAIQGTKRYIAENPASATMMAIPFGMGAVNLGRQGFNALRNFKPTKDLHTTGHEFSGNLELEHKGDLYRDKWLPPEEVNPNIRYDGGETSVFGKKTYLAENDKWHSGYYSGMGGKGVITKVNANFDKAFVLSPETTNQLWKILGKNKKGKLNERELASALEEKGYDGLIVRGWDDYRDKKLNHYFNEIEKYWEGKLPKEQYEKYSKEVDKIEDELKKKHGIWHYAQQDQIVSFKPHKQLETIGGYTKYDPITKEGLSIEQKLHEYPSYYDEWLEEVGPVPGMAHSKGLVPSQAQGGSVTEKMLWRKKHSKKH